MEKALNTLKPKIIIVEGQDRTGKTTLIKALRSNIENPRFLGLGSSNPPKKCKALEWSQDHYNSLINLFFTLQTEGWTVISDRFHIGETVYGPIFRGTDTNYIWEYDKRFENNADVWLITLTDYSDKLMSRDDGLSNEKEYDDYEKVRQGFIKSHNKSLIQNKLLINISDDGWVNPTKILEMIYA